AYDSSGKLPVTLGTTQVTFDGMPAPLLSVVAGEIWAVAPYGVGGKSQTQVKVSTAAGSANTTVPVGVVVPAVFGVQAASGGRRLVALNDDGSLNGAQNPAKVGSEVAVFATGLGQTTPASMDGVARTADRAVAASMEVFVNNAPATVVYAGP